MSREVAQLLKCQSRSPQTDSENGAGQIALRPKKELIVSFTNATFS